MSERLMGFHGRQQLQNYINAVEDVKKKAEKNFLEMDFENADRRRETKEIIEDMKVACDKVVSVMETITFD